MVVDINLLLGTGYGEGQILVLSQQLEEYLGEGAMNRKPGEGAVVVALPARRLQARTGSLGREPWSLHSQREP